VLPNGVDRTLFQLMPREAAREQLGWPIDEVTVLFAGNPDVARKRFALARAACEHAARDVQDLRLRVCTGLEHAAVPALMNAADTLLLTAIAEGSPNAVKEALACDLPIVATDAGDVSELFAGVSRCRLVPVSADAHAVAEALVDVLRDAPQRSDGRRSTSHLADEGIAAQLAAIYGRVAGGSFRLGRAS
jgi:glycosyltransferase involved in cell wall biosynthesis